MPISIEAAEDLKAQVEELKKPHPVLSEPEAAKLITAIDAVTVK